MPPLRFMAATMTVLELSLSKIANEWEGERNFRKKEAGRGSETIASLDLVQFARVSDFSEVKSAGGITPKIALCGKVLAVYAICAN